MDSLHANYERAVNSAITDKLTGLYNQAYLKHFLDFEIKRSLRQKTPLSFLMIDIDKFKLYNDELGHLAGDQVLKELGKYSTVVIPAKAGIQKDTGCRIKSGMTGVGYLVAML